MKGSEEVKSWVSSLWGLQVVMEWCWKLGLHDTVIIHSYTASHLWWTFPSMSSKCPWELQWIHCSMDGVGCLWCGKLGRTQRTCGIPWSSSMVHCCFSAQMVIQILWKSSLAPLSQCVWNCLGVSWWWWIWWSSHQSWWSQFCSNKTDLFPGCTTHVMELHWHFQLAWLLWNLIGRFHIFPQLCRCHHLFRAKTETPWLLAYIFPLPGILHVFPARLSFTEWRVWELWNPWMWFHLWWTGLPNSSNRYGAPVEAAFTHKAIHLKHNTSATWT